MNPIKPPLYANALGEMARTKGDVVARSQYLKSVLIKLAGDKEIDLDCLVNFMVINISGLQISYETLSNCWGDKNEAPTEKDHIQ